MALPALQVRVPNPANALLQAEQIKGARAQSRAFQRQEAGQNALLTAFQNNDFTTPAGQQAIIGQVGQVAPTRALELQERFGRLNAQDQAKVAQEGRTTARALVGVRDQASYTQALSTLPPQISAGLPAEYQPQVVQSTIQQAQTIDNLTVSAGTQAQIDAANARNRATNAAADARARPTPRTNLGKISADLSSGFTTPAQALRQSQQALAPNETWRPMNAAERTAFNIPEGQGAQISSTGKGATIGSGSGITIFGPDGNIIAQVGGNPLTNRQQGSEAIEIANEVRQADVRLSELSTALTSLRQNPQAAGVPGIVIEKVGGVIEQLQQLTGTNGDWLGTRAVQRTRTQLSALLGQYIPTITGDESGRYSDQDARRADAALPAKVPTASFPQVEEALLTLQDIETRSRGRALMRGDGFAPGIDITYPDGQLRYVRQLQREGKTFDEAANIVADLLLRYALPPEVVGIQ